MDIKFAPRAWSMFAQHEIEAAGPELIRLEQELKGIDRHRVYIAASPKNSPLHVILFKESIAEAACQWRLLLAGRLIQAVGNQKTEGKGKEMRSVVYPVFVPLVMPPYGPGDLRKPRERRLYVSIDRAARTPLLRRRLADIARRSFLALQSRHQSTYAQIPEFAKEFGPLWKELNRLRAKR